MKVENGWITQIQEQERVPVTLRKSDYNKNNKPYIFCSYKEGTFCANVSEEDMNKELGRDYDLLCTGHSRNGYPYLKLVEKSSTPPEQKRDTVTQYFIDKDNTKEKKESELLTSEEVNYILNNKSTVDNKSTVEEEHVLHDFELLQRFKEKLNVEDPVVDSLVQRLEQQLLSKIGEVYVEKKKEENSYELS